MPITIRSKVLILLFCLPLPFQAQDAAASKKSNVGYIMTPSGLSLRAENSLQSEKLTVMPLGGKVSVIEERTGDSIVVEGIKGQLIKVHYDGKEGYCFSGFISELPLPKEGEAVNDYISSIKKTFPEAAFFRKRNDPDFHEGYTDFYTLPTKKWHEAYYIAHALHRLPKKLGFPGDDGPEKEEIPDPEKEEMVWGSSLLVNRALGKIEKITYSFRTEGFGYSVIMHKTENDFLTVENVNFVD